MENDQQGVIEIDLKVLFFRLLHRLWAIILVAILFAACTLGYTVLFVDPLYSASTLIYVNNSDISIGSTTVSFSTSELSAAQSLVDTYSVILKSRTTLEEIIELDGLSYSYEELYDMIDTSAVDSTEIFSVTVTSTSPTEAEYIANTIGEVLPARIEEIVDGSSIRIVDSAVIPDSRVSPSYSRSVVLGGLVGAIVAIIVIVLRYIFDENIHTEEYLIQTYPDLPLLAVVPDMTSKGDTGYGYGYGYKSPPKERLESGGSVHSEREH